MDLSVGSIAHVLVSVTFLLTVGAADVAVDGDATGFRADLGMTLLRINDVDGKKLESPIDVEFGRASRDVRKPTAGERFDYYVHEYGHFDGEVEPPKELNIPKLPVASNGFHYQRYVTVHASNAIRK